jgi:hypothetical protein
MFMRIFFVCTAVRLYNDNKQNPHKLFAHEDFVFIYLKIISNDTFLFF